MRANEFINESAVDDLADRLPTLHKHDYDTIDKLMQRISKRYKITGDKLHDLFVNKYGNTPDTWIKKYKNKLNEDGSPEDIRPHVEEFVKWTVKVLNLKSVPKITLSSDGEQAREGHHTGLHSDDGIWVYVGNRNLVDIFRTIFHELVHERQDQLNMIKPGDSYPGSPIEAMADMMAGKYIKIYGKAHPEIFQ